MKKLIEKIVKNFYPPSAHENREKIFCYICHKKTEYHIDLKLQQIKCAYCGWSYYKFFLERRLREKLFGKDV